MIKVISYVTVVVAMATTGVMTAVMLARAAAIVFGESRVNNILKRAQDADAKPEEESS